MNYTIKVDEKDLNTIITALKFEKIKAEEENNNVNLDYINSAIGAIDKSMNVDFSKE